MKAVFSPHLRATQPLAVSLIGNGISQSRMSHAYLLVGRSNEEKWLMAKELAAYLNCGDADKETKGSCLSLSLSDVKSDVKKDSDSMCRDCRWIREEAHPQAWLKLSAEGKGGGRKIPVAAARALTDELAKTSSSYRVVIVDNANQDVFHRPAANALLKTIEEPPPYCLFLLFAEHEDRVLPTVVSRCQVVPILKRPYADRKEDGLPDLRISSFLSGSKGKTARYWLDASEYARSLVECAEKMGGAEEGRDAACRVIDHAVCEEIRDLMKSAAVDGAAASYAVELLKLADTAKRQSESYVGEKPLLESFALSWARLLAERN